MGTCENDDSLADSYGDTCSSYYDSYPAGCGSYDTVDFIAARECCVCGGGSTGYYEESGDSGSGGNSSESGGSGGSGGQTRPVKGDREGRRWYTSMGALSTMARQGILGSERSQWSVSARKALFEQFYYALDLVEDGNMNSTCSASSECDDGLVAQCCVSIIMTSTSTGETDQINRCMVEGVIESTWDWTVTTDEDTNDELNV